MTRTTTLVVRKDTWNKLKDLKDDPDQTFDYIINSLIEAMEE